MFTNGDIVNGIPKFGKIEYNQGQEFIQNAINSSKPVALLNTFNPTEMTRVHDNARGSALEASENNVNGNGQDIATRRRTSSVLPSALLENKGGSILQ